MEAEIAPRHLVELIDVAQPHEIGASRPGVQRLQTLVLIGRHERHRLGDVLADQVIRPRAAAWDIVPSIVETLLETMKRFSAGWALRISAQTVGRREPVTEQEAILVIEEEADGGVELPTRRFGPVISPPYLTASSPVISAPDLQPIP